MAITMGISIQSDFGSEFEVTSLRRALTAYIEFLGFGLVWILTQAHYIPYNPAVAWISNSLSLLCMTLASYYWFFFAMARIRRTDKRPGRLAYLDLSDTDRACNGIMSDDTVDRLGISDCGRWYIPKRRIVRFCVIPAISV